MSNCEQALVFVDACSRYIWAFEIRTKDARAILTCWERLHAWIKTQTGRSVKSIQTDNGTEFVNDSFDNFNNLQGITHRLTVPYAHEQNGLVERANRTLADGVLS